MYCGCYVSVTRSSFDITLLRYGCMTQIACLMSCDCNCSMARFSLTITLLWKIDVTVVVLLKLLVLISCDCYCSVALSSFAIISMGK